MGDIWNTWYLNLLSNPGIRWIYRHSTEEGFFEMDSAELLTMLEGVSLQQKEIKQAIIEMIKNNLDEIEASK
jgi:hypothetical protein